ncbi:transposase [Streptomyces sp. TS71-3]|uniref:transposase n=1 Tax=Streptomyces sp. TS71-3 TaxID=2733862 RepID=UPI001B07CBE5|nr:transposase [Streptomyces sp. TS71-3]GHJ41323.1 hypothetical protein Sm713_69320 [Streptomyces sp. TS71-3]
MTYERKCDLLDLLDVRIEIVRGHEGQTRPGGCPFETWFTSRGKLVPSPLTDEQWTRVEHIFPQPRKTIRTISPRIAFEGSLMKVRNGMQWQDLPESFGRHLSVYQRALDYLQEGVWGEARCVRWGTTRAPLCQRSTPCPTSRSQVLSTLGSPMRT